MLGPVARRALPVRPAVAVVRQVSCVLAAVVGLALQDTLGNLFSGIALHLEGAFEVGDVIHSGEYVGVVESVSWRATRMRGFNNQIIVLPNSVIARERLEIFPRSQLNARVLQLGVDYNIPPATVIGIVSQAAAHVEGVASEVPCFARVATFADPVIDGWWSAVRALPDRQRAAVVLHYLEDRPLTEVALALGIAVGTVKATLSKARTTLARTLTKEG